MKKICVCLALLALLSLLVSCRGNDETGKDPTPSESTTVKEIILPTVPI